MEPGIKKLTEAVKRDCREGQGCFNPNGCDHEFIRHVPENDPSMMRLVKANIQIDTQCKSMY